ncbi:MAG: alkaline phosphatase [Bacteroidales bacterium]|nr:alkaline phosphatase [Bacteroidales bacterium]
MARRFTLFLLTILVCSTCFTSCRNASKDDGKAKYIFLFIGDGMGHTNVFLTESYMSYKAGKLGGEQLTFTKFPYQGDVTNYTAESNITCSAAAGTAIATGYKTRSGFIGVDADTVSHPSIAELLKAEGYKVGIITSVPMNDATPSVFYAHNSSRGNGYEIAQSIASSGFDFVAGNGFKKHKNKEGKYIGDYLSENGIKVCYSEEEFKMTSKEDRVVMCEPYNNNVEPRTYFAGAPVPEGHMSISQFLENALEKFEEEPFFIMCEGGEIDWAAHSKKTMPTIMSILEFDNAVRKAYEFYLKHPDETLIVVTADHATGGSSLGSGDTHLYSVDWEPLVSAFEAAGCSNTLNQEDNKKLNDASRIGWTTSDHTGDNVPVYAIGKGAERFCGRMDNTQIKGKILAE